MLRLCSDSSRSYPGRSVRVAAPDTWVCALHGNMPGIGQKSAEAIVGVGRRFQAIKRLETSPVEQSGSLTPPKGRTKKGEEPQ
jgi:hypothetical protein